MEKYKISFPKQEVVSSTNGNAKPLKQENTSVFDEESSAKKNLAIDAIGLGGFFTSMAGLCTMSISNDYQFMHKIKHPKLSKGGLICLIGGFAALLTAGLINDKNKIRSEKQ